VQIVMDMSKYITIFLLVSALKSIDMNTVR
jgi:hypothetical protein